MQIALAILCGLIWGLLAALLGGRILRRAIAKNSNGAIMAANFLRTLVDLAALGLVFLASDLLPFVYTWILIATAVALSLGLVFISFRIARQK